MSFGTRLNTFPANVAPPQPLKPTENLCFSNVFKEYKSESLAEIVL